MTALSKEEYLKRYLNPVESGDYKKRKKKKKDKIKPGHGMKIVDDDVSWNNIAPKEEDFPDALLTQEEKPQIEVIDNRTKKEKELDKYRKSNKWKTFKEQNEKKESDNEIIFGDMDDVPRRRTSVSPQRPKRHDSSSDMEVPRTRHDSDSDNDVPHKKLSKKNHARRERHDSGRPKRQDSDSDLDVKRSKNPVKLKNVSKKRHDSTSSDSDLNVLRPRESSKGRRTRHDSDSDLDIPRSKSSINNGNNHKSYAKDRERHKEVAKSRHDSSSDSDLDIPRAKSSLKQNHRKSAKDSSDSDMDVPRPRKSRHDSDSDLEIPRHKKDKIMETKKRTDSKHNKTQMTSGGAGGLTSRHELKKELLENKKRDTDIDKLARETKQNATVFREKGGKKRDLEKERAQQEEEDKIKQKKLDKYDKWGKGLVQDNMKNYALEELIHEANKPLARYRDDADLDAYQRSQVRDGDPMAEYLAKKKSKETSNAPSLPKYRGPAPAPNRYNIQPGYRWDGVDRSNGFEKKYFMNISEKTAQKQDAYKWSVEDM